jgi:hypothetical protein
VQTVGGDSKVIRSRDQGEGQFAQRVRLVMWKALIDSIKSGECTPFIGAGACVPFLPTAQELAEALASEFKYPHPTTRHDLTKVSQFLAVDNQEARFPKRRIARLLDLANPIPETEWPNKNSPLAVLYRKCKLPNFKDETEIHCVLAHLKSKIYLTTNYDDFMFQALSDWQLKPERAICRWNNNLLQMEPSPFDTSDEGVRRKPYDPGPNDPVVFHLHGHVGIPASIVVSEDDYIDFMMYVSRDLAESKKQRGQKTMLPLAIRRAITNHMLLVVGYSFGDQNLLFVLRTLLQSLAVSDKHMNISVQLKPQANGDAQAEKEMLEKYVTYLEKRYQWSLNVSVHWGTAADFAAELRKRLREEGCWP